MKIPNTIKASALGDQITRELPAGATLTGVVTERGRLHAAVAWLDGSTSVFVWPAGGPVEERGPYPPGYAAKTLPPDQTGANP